MAEVPGLRTELLEDRIGQGGGVADRHVDGRDDEEGGPARHEQLDDGGLGRLAQLDHRAVEARLGQLGALAGPEQVHDHDRVVDADPVRHDEHERVTQEGVCEMVEQVGVVLLLARLRVEHADPVEDERAARGDPARMAGAVGRARGTRTR